MPVIASDTFTRADNDVSLGSTEVGAMAWAVSGGVFGVLAGRARKVSAAASYGFALLNSGSPDAEVAMTVVTTDAYGGLCIRSDATGANCWFLQMGPNQRPVFYRLLNGAAGVYSSPNALFPILVAGDVLKVGAVGNRLYAKVNDVEYFSYYDSLHGANTRHGFLAYDLATRFDNFVLQTTPTPPPPPVVGPHTLEAVVAALATALDAVPDLRVYPFPADIVAAPAVVLTLPDSEFSIVQGAGESYTWTFPLWLFVAKADDRAGAAELRKYLEPIGTYSIRQAVEVDRSLSGSCDSVQVLGVSTSIASVAGTSFLAAEFTLEVVG